MAIASDLGMAVASDSGMGVASDSGMAVSSDYSGRQQRSTVTLAVPPDSPPPLTPMTHFLRACLPAGTTPAATARTMTAVSELLTQAYPLDTLQTLYLTLDARAAAAEAAAEQQRRMPGVRPEGALDPGHHCRYCLF